MYPSQEIIPYLSVVVAAFNEAEAIDGVVRDILGTLEAAGAAFEVLVVDDGSSDRTKIVLLELQRCFPKTLRVIGHVVNKGQGAALRAAIRLARGEIIIMMDSDGQHMAADILGLTQFIPPYDLVVGARTGEYGGQWYRNLANRFYNRFASWLTQYPILDLTSGFRAMRRETALHFLPLFPARFSTATTTTLAYLKAGYSVTFIPVDVQPRTKGASKINALKDGRRFFMIILRMIMLYDPLRIFFPISTFLFLLGVLAMGFGIWVAERLVVPGSAVVLFIAAVLTILLGLVAGQISNSLVHYYGDEYVQVYEPPPAEAHDD